MPGQMHPPLETLHLCTNAHGQPVTVRDTVLRERGIDPKTLSSLYHNPETVTHMGTVWKSAQDAFAASARVKKAGNLQAAEVLHHAGTILQHRKDSRPQT